VLDVGCGVKPYRPLFAPYADDYVGVDVGEDTAADIVGVVESLPVADASFDVVVCTQVLEHCDDPAAAVRELRRVVAPGGRVLVSTHGVYVYHPRPHDRWRWTHEGLEQLFRANGDWRSLVVRPGSGTTACLAMLVAIYLDLALKRARVRELGRPLIAALNAGAAALDRRVTSLREPIPGSLFANYHVTAEP
jgi:SAM-dependent methyltransferase